MLDNVAGTTATVVERLTAAGGIILGKTKTVECAFGGWGTNQKLGTFMNENIFKQLNIISYDQFCNNDSNEALIAGTVMTINEKKSAKGTPYAIIKFSDNKGEFELFLFSLINFLW